MRHRPSCVSLFSRRRWRAMLVGQRWHRLRATPCWGGRQAGAAATAAAAADSPLTHSLHCLHRGPSSWRWKNIRFRQEFRNKSLRGALKTREYIWCLLTFQVVLYNSQLWSRSRKRYILYLPKKKKYWKNEEYWFNCFTQAKIRLYRFWNAIK